MSTVVGRRRKRLRRSRGLIRAGGMSRPGRRPGTGSARSGQQARGQLAGPSIRSEAWALIRSKTDSISSQRCSVTLRRARTSRSTYVPSSEPPPMLSCRGAPPSRMPATQPSARSSRRSSSAARSGSIASREAVRISSRSARVSSGKKRRSSVPTGRRRLRRPVASSTGRALRGR